jgi:hypothetical protein
MKYIDPNKLYKPSNNKIDIIPNNVNYDYGSKIDHMVCYIFDKQLFCKCISVPNALEKITHVTEMWPKDVYPMFVSMFESTFDQPQTLHMIVNGTHVLFNTNLFLNLKEKVHGIILHEIPYTQVQVYRRQTPSFHFFQNILMDEKGVIHGMERKNWDDMIKKMRFGDKWMSENLIKQNVLSKFPDFTQTFYSKIFSSIKDENSPVQFMICSENDNHLITYFNSVGVFDNKNEKMLLLTQEIIENETIDAIVPEKAIIYNLHTEMDQCIICRRVQLLLPEYYKDFYARNVVNDIHSVEPLLHPTQRLPWLGRRGMLGHQYEDSLNVITKEGIPNCIQVWEKPQRFNITQRVVKKYKASVCKICCNEWHWLLSKIINENIEATPTTTTTEKSNTLFYESETFENVSSE